MADTLSWTERVQRTLVRVGTVLRDAGVPFALTGGSAVYARGGPSSEHDVDVPAHKLLPGPR